MSLILQIVPRLPPLIDGVGDYALNLAHRLREDYDIHTQFIIADPTWSGGDEVEGFRCHRIRQRTSQALFQLSQLPALPDALLLHFVGYGYDSQGLPFWLLQAIRGWLAACPTVVMQTMMHEVWASGPWWKKSFYLRYPQQWITQQVIAQSHSVVTSTLCMKQMLDDLGGSPAVLVPVPSNVPPQTRPPDPQPPTSLKLAIFGQLASRVLTIRLHQALLTELDHRDLIREVVLIGREAQADSADAQALMAILPAHRIRVAGELSPAQIAAELGSADLYLSFCDAYLACKSTALMAALACGCPAILKEGEEAAPLQPGAHFWVCDGSGVAVDHLVAALRSQQLGEVGRAGQRWYLENASWKQAAERWHTLLSNREQAS